MRDTVLSPAFGTEVQSLLQLELAQSRGTKHSPSDQEGLQSGCFLAKAREVLEMLESVLPPGAAALHLSDGQSSQVWGDRDLLLGTLSRAIWSSGG